MADYKIKHEPYVELRLSMTELGVLRRIYSDFESETDHSPSPFEGEEYEAYAELSEVLWELATSSVFTDYNKNEG